MPVPDSHQFKNQAADRMHPSDVIKNKNALQGQEIELHGWLCSGNETFVQESESASDMKIWLPHPLVVEAMLDVVPVLVGGPWLYFGGCTVTGTLTDVGGRPVMQPAAIVYSISDDERYAVSFPRAT
jgi:hypothetical protein